MLFWRNLKIGVRLAVGIGLILVMLAVVAGAAYLGLSNGNASFTEYRGLARQTAAAGQINSRLLSTRLGVKEFLLKGTDASVDTVSKAIDGLQAEITKSQALFGDSGSKQQDIQGIATSATDYGANFAKVVAFRKERDTLVADMNTIGPKIEQSLTGIFESAHTRADAAGTYQAGEALRNLLLARLYFNKFLIDNLPEQIERVQKEAASLETASNALLATATDPTERGLIDDITKMQKAYFADFDGVQKAILARNDIIENQLNKIGPAMAAKADQIVTDNKAAQDELGPRASAAMQQSLTIALIVSAIALITGLLAGYVVARGITRPVTAMTTAMGVLAAGDTTVEIPARGQRDEIGAMANAVQVFKDNMIETTRLRAEQEAAKKRTEEERRRGMLDLADKFESSVGGVVSAVTSAAEELQATAQSLSATAEETARQSNVVAAASEQMTQNVQTVASATEELSASIHEISNQVVESTRIVGDAVVQAEDTNSKVKGLSEAAKKIGDVVTLINQIAGQTNLLALNATIEAARAGDAGKGFAVVASEVKNLATQTARATEEIAGQVRAIQESTESSAQAINTITHTINRVNEISTTIASAVEEQGAATQEISRNVQEAAAGTTEVSNNITGVTQASQQTSAGSTQVLSAASELARNGAVLRQQVDDFLREIRAG